MRHVPLLALLALPIAAHAQPLKLPKLTDEACARHTDRVRKPAPSKATPRKLGEMPPAKGYYTVYREAGGCPVPAAVKDEAARR
ncbi:hypothetical protein GGQ80_002391 [Sphingomonas jinjuensis]|uniref:Uncharacterized protein n=1 Tax=Sphingomonas jinjuensis TaxID=535907 RepID=A0A840FKL2_9SPHN|nr:hypothetical protein [Sphingomonas jinjuensis]MBB4154478.1 hypothetical protein [Sphingomonas jinjuensis]